jgi:glycosyltransferase involved in cell wall biosynthesis
LNILYIWDSDYPWDVRVEKICKSLFKYGYNVHIAARNLKRLPTYEKVEGLHIHRLKTLKHDLLNSAASFPIFFSPVWKSFLNTLIHNNDIEIIIVRDLPMSAAGILAGRKKQIPVIFDMAENYVAMLRCIWKRRKYEGFNFIVRNPYIAKYVERYVLKNVEHIFVVVEETRDKVLQEGVSSEKITIIRNTPPLEVFDNHKIQLNNNLKLIKERFSAIYTGGIQLGRGIHVVLDAIPEIIKEIADFLFVIIGDGYATEYFKKIITSRNLQDHVLWLGWVDHKNIYDYIRVSKIGLIPHLVTEHVNTTIPNKLFDYMGFSLPVVATEATPIIRILREEKCGVTYKDRDTKDLLRALLEIYNNISNFGNNGARAVRFKYNWGMDEKRLLIALENIKL